MNAPVKIERTGDKAIWDAVHAWRGACMQFFAEGEEAVGEALAKLSSVEDRGDVVRLRHLLGQKLEDLADVIEADGPFAAEGKAVAKALADFRSHEALRAHLAHSVAHVVVERNGDWIIVFRRLSIRSGKPERETRTVDKTEAVETENTLRRHAQSLRDNLRNLVSRVRA